MSKSKNKDDSRQIISNSLSKIVKGTSIVFAGTLIGTFLNFLIKIVIIKNISQYQYGLISLGIMLVSLLASLGSIGLNTGIPRQISYYKEKDKSKVGYLVSSSLIITMIIGVSLAFIIFIFAGKISIIFFNEENLIRPLRLFGIAIPFAMLLGKLIAIFRGFERVKEKLFFHNLMRPLTYLSIIGAVLLLSNFVFLGIIYAYISSFVITSIIASFFLYKQEIEFKLGKKIKPVGKNLILFSLPLFGTLGLNLLLNWGDTFLLGFFKNPEIVGLYEAVYPLAKFTNFGLGMANFIFVPIISKLYANNRMKETKKTYQIVAKWIYFIMFPVFFILLLYPKLILGFLFKDVYMKGGLILRILTLGFIVRAIVGLNGPTLVSMGKTKIVFYGSLIGVGLNLILNVALIPSMGVAGAAIASGIAYTCTNLHNSIRLYLHTKIQPFYRSYFKVIIGSAVIFLLFFLISKVIKTRIWMIPIIMSVYLLLFLLYILYTNSYDKEDIDLIVKMEKKTKLKIPSFIKNLLKKHL